MDAKRDSAERRLDRQIGRIIELLPAARRRPFLDSTEAWSDRQRGSCRRRAAGPLNLTPAEPVFAACVTEVFNRRVRELAEQFPAVNSVARSDCFAYEPDTVELNGKLERRTYPGKPNYESVARGDEAEIGFYLLVAEPLCVTRNLDEVNAPAAGVAIVQLVLDSSGYNRLRPSLGRELRVTGTLFHSHTGHHHAELLLRVSK